MAHAVCPNGEQRKRCYLPRHLPFYPYHSPARPEPTPRILLPNLACLPAHVRLMRRQPASPEQEAQRAFSHTQSLPFPPQQPAQPRLRAPVAWICPPRQSSSTALSGPQFRSIPALGPGAGSATAAARRCGLGVTAWMGRRRPERSDSDRGPHLGLGTMTVVRVGRDVDKLLVNAAVRQRVVSSAD